MTTVYSKTLNVTVALFLSISVFGCSGNTGTATNNLSGTVASGAPVAKGTVVTIKDANGVSVTTTTLDANGHYNMPVDNLTPPFVICVDGTLPPTATPCAPGTGTSDKVLVAVVADNKGGTANVTPLTKLAAAIAAGVTDPTSIFNAGTQLKALTADKITQGLTTITTIIGDYLKAAGIDPLQFNPLTTAFNADSKGADSVMDVVKFKLDATGKVVISFKGYTSNKPSFDISKPFAQYSTVVKTDMKKAFGNVAAQIAPPDGVPPIIPSNVTLPPGFKIQENATIPADVQIPPGVTIPSGVTFDSTVKIDPSVSIPSDVIVPTGAKVEVSIPSNAIIPKGVTFPPGTTIPSGVTLPTGFALTEGVSLSTGTTLPDNVDLSNMTTTLPTSISIPSSALVPTSWQTAPPGYVKVPVGVTYGSAPTTPTAGATTPTAGTTTPTTGTNVNSCSQGFVEASQTTKLPFAAACGTYTVCSNTTNIMQIEAIFVGKHVLIDLSKSLDTAYISGISAQVASACGN